MNQRTWNSLARKRSFFSICSLERVLLQRGRGPPAEPLPSLFPGPATLSSAAESPCGWPLKRRLDEQTSHSAFLGLRYPTDITRRGPSIVGYPYYYCCCFNTTIGEITRRRSKRFI